MGSYKLFRIGSYVFRQAGVKVTAVAKRVLKLEIVSDFLHGFLYNRGRNLCLGGSVQ